jgi:hypothetical protein
VEVETGAGDLHRVERVSATGDPERPLDDDALDAKVAGLFGWAGLDGRRGRELFGECRGMVDDGEVFALPA